MQAPRACARLPSIPGHTRKCTGYHKAWAARQSAGIRSKEHQKRLTEGLDYAKASTEITNLRELLATHGPQKFPYQQETWLHAHSGGEDNILKRTQWKS